LDHLVMEAETGSPVELMRTTVPMRSPFPGMDPYLERHWRDIHASLIIYTRDQLEDQLPDNLIARVEERLVLESDDVGEPAVETFINIIDPSTDHWLVKVIEILSLANKLPGEGQRLYRQKQQELRAAQISLVEIDLLRKGQRVLTLPASLIPRQIRSTYQACVRRGWTPDSHEIYALPIRAALPVIRIPLREHDEEIRLDLQAVLDQAYRKGRYYLTINYKEPPEPPFQGEDAKWAKAIVKKAKIG
jgi:hypothetical protein